MSNQSKGLHHYHIRKRIYQKHEPFPHPQKLKRNYDKLISVIAFVAPLANLPQLFKIFSEKDALGVSAISWVFFFIIAAIWLGYGILHKDRNIITMYSLLMVTEASIIVGIIFYG
ncbi:MAG: SemiSWEET family transporter [Bacteriovorax sp.]|nr:SemiSWEET family transporter [Bacteriovorax sp.]